MTQYFLQHSSRFGAPCLQTLRSTLSSPYSSLQLPSSATPIDLQINSTTCFAQQNTTGLRYLATCMISTIKPGNHFVICIPLWSACASQVSSKITSHRLYNNFSYIETDSPIAGNNSSCLNHHAVRVGWNWTLSMKVNGVCGHTSGWTLVQTEEVLH
jgi:hypothetical protein